MKLEIYIFFNSVHAPGELYLMFPNKYMQIFQQQLVLFVKDSKTYAHKSIWTLIYHRPQLQKYPKSNS